MLRCRITLVSIVKPIKHCSRDIVFVYCEIQFTNILYYMIFASIFMNKIGL